MDRINGQIEKVLFHNEENGFCVISVSSKQYNKPITLTGNAGSISNGEWITADGEWIIDNNYGKQFKSLELQISPPNNLDGIEKYLASDLVKGIGKEYAGRLVKEFGADVFNVIEHNSIKLLKVEGIGKTRKNNIKKAWNEQKNIRDIMTFLFSCGIGTSKAFRIHKTYGEKAIQIIKDDPYSLVREIRGIGFLIADQVAMKIGIPKDSLIRAKAGIEYTLDNLMLEGHCAFIKNDLISKTSSLLNLDILLIESAIEKSLEDKNLILVNNEINEQLIYLPKFYHAEKSLSERIKKLAKGFHPCPNFNLEKAINWAETQSDIGLSKEQKEALKLTLRSKISVITGGPGVGKTTLLNTVLKILKAKRMRVLCCAPTGRAAKRMSESTGLESKTIHRLLQHNPTNGGFIHNANNPLPCDILIIDESSMIDLMLCYNLINAVPLHAGIIFVGDINQLPSVGPGKVLKDIISSKIASISHLNEVFRQSLNSNIISFSHVINDGELPNFSDISNKSDCFFIEAEDPNKAINLINKLLSESIPKKFNFNSMKDIQVLSPMKKGLLGTNNLNKSIQNLLNKTNKEIKQSDFSFRLNDRVMQTENDYDKDVYNGDLGFIHSINEINKSLVVNFDNHFVEYDFRELDMLVHSYAITIHKSQGSEYPVVIIPMHTQHYVMLKRSLFYTALTRAKKLAIIIGTLKSLRLAVKQVDSSNRITMLSEYLSS